MTASPRERDERGAVFVFSVMILGVLMIIASFVIDVGVDRIVRTDMQSLADTTALDMATVLDGSQTTTQILASSAYSTTKRDTLARNAKSTAVTVNPNDVEIVFGVADANGAWLRSAGGSDYPNAVKVSASGKSSIRLWPGSDAAKPRRQATAVQLPPQACITAGASLADLTPGGTLDILLGRLIGINRLSLVSPDGLANLAAQVPLLKLAAKLGVGSVNELATLSTKTPQGFVIAMAEVLTAEGKVAAATVLHNIAAKLSATTKLNVGDILAVGTGNGAAADLGLDAFSLVQAVIQAANKDSFVDLGVPINVPGLLGADVRARVISAPVSACGPKGTVARSAQIALSITTEVAVLGGLVAKASLNPLEITIADGSATIGDVSCTSSGGSVVVAADTAGAKLRLNLETALLAIWPFEGLKISVGVPDPDVYATGASIAASTNSMKTFTFGPSGMPAAQTYGSGVNSLGLSSLTPLKVDALGIPLGSLLSEVVRPLLLVVDPLVSTLLNALLVPLGLDLGKLQVTPSGRPVCNAAALRK